MKRKTILLFILSIGILSSCSSSQKVPSISRPEALTLNLNILRNPNENTFINLDYGIKVQVYDFRSKKNIVTRYDANPIFAPETVTYPKVDEFILESSRKYMKQLGFRLNSDVETDYLISLKLKEMNLSWFSNSGWTADVSMAVEVVDQNNRSVYPNVTVTGRSSRASSSTDYSTANLVVNEAFTNLYEDIDWSRIAYFLKKTNPNLHVSGNGTTALESTVINWYVESTPRGADVSMRVISSTPDVKNTNTKFLGSTPYEATESFDIKGLSYNNSGNVQIEVICEKAGYVTQKKRFNLKSVIDQKEVSTKFNLVKEE